MTTLNNRNPNSSFEYETPSDLYKEVCAWAGVEPNLDACATERNRKCEDYISKEEDALNQSWNRGENTVVWLNIPNQLSKRFIEKAYSEWEKHNMDVLIIMPLQSLGTRYIEPLWAHFESGQFGLKPIFKRPRFLRDKKPEKDCSPFSYVSLHMRKRI